MLDLDAQTNNTKGPSIFPILFAAVIGRCMISLALWRLQNGEKIGTLDQLLGSVSLFSTFSTHLRLRAFNVLAVFLGLLWIFSPVGGQASIRILGYATSSSSVLAPIQYLDVRNNYSANAMADIGEPQGIMNTLYRAALASSWTNQHSSMDIWGNIKIPMIENITHPADSEGWIPISAANATFTSLIGLPLTGLPSTPGNSTFNIETSYYVLDCRSFVEAPKRNVSNLGQDKQAGQLEITSPPRQNYTTEAPYSNSSQWTARPMFFDTDSKGKVNITIQANCTVVTSYVEVAVHCNNRECGVKSIRNSTLNNPQRTWTNLDSIWRVWSDFGLGWSLAESTGVNYDSAFTPALTYIVNPQNPFDDSIQPDVFNAGKDRFQLCLTQLMNTFWLAGIDKTAVPAGSNNTDLAGSVNHDHAILRSTAAPATVSTNFEILVCYRPWFAILMISCLILLAASFATIVLDTWRIGPDVDMSISSMTRDNPFVGSTGIVPGSWEDAVHRGLKLKRVRVKLGDVLPDAEVGHVAIGLERQTRELSNSRLYD